MNQRLGLSQVAFFVLGAAFCSWGLFASNCRLVLTPAAAAHRLRFLMSGVQPPERRTTMATHPDLPPDLPVEPDEGPNTPPNEEPTDPEPPPTLS
jgi:hypothetical protein